MQLYQFIAMELKRKQSLNDSVRDSAEENLTHVEKNFLPSGSGIDSGCKIENYKFSNKDELEWFEIAFGYHHMNDVGYYTNWTDHNLRVKADYWIGFTMSISGKDQNQIKEYLYDTFHMALSEDRLRSEFEKPV